MVILGRWSPRDFHYLRGNLRAGDVLRWRFGNPFLSSTYDTGRRRSGRNAVERADRYVVPCEFFQTRQLEFVRRPSLDRHAFGVVRQALVFVPSNDVPYYIT